MIEITHKQARRLIRAAQDSTAGGPALPEEQWAALQAHLEQCPDCRAFRKNWQAVERSLSRELSQHWKPVSGPGHDVPETVVHARRSKAVRQRAAAKGMYALAALLVVLAVVVWARLPRQASPLPVSSITPAPSPTPEPSFFSGVIAFAASTPGGSSDIFLLNASPGLETPEKVNLTQHPAADIHPTWSPDGEWLAFLSDRDSQEGLFDLYVTNVAGTRLTRLTYLADIPGPTWAGPLSWSADGRWIAGLVRQPDVQGNAIFRVAVDGGPSLTFGGPSVSGQVRFSPQGPLLAFLNGPDSRGQERVEVYNAETGAVLQLTQVESVAEDMRAGIHSAFDWSADGRSLVYISEGPYSDGGVPDNDAQTRIRLSDELDDENFIVYDSSANRTAIQADRPGAYLSVTWGPEDELVFLQDAEGDGCRTLFTRAADRRRETPRELSGLCVRAGGELPGLDRANWKPLERWLVVEGSQPGQQPGLYAIYIPRSDEPLEFERLGEADGLSSALRVRPTRQARSEGRQTLAVDPRPSGSVAGSALPGIVPPAELLDRLLVVTGDRDGRVIRRGIYTGQSGPPVPATGKLLPGVQRILAGSGDNTCPSWSPDGQWIAYLTDTGSTRLPGKEVHLMDATGSASTRLTWLPFPIRRSGGQLAAGSPGFECPVWSPGGEKLAAVVRGRAQDYLAVVSLNENSTASVRQASLASQVLAGGLLIDWAGTRYIPVDDVPQGARPHWDPTGQRVLLPSLEPSAQEGSLQIIDPETPGSPSYLVSPDGWQAVDSPTFSPSGRWMAYTALNFREQSVLAQLRITDSSGDITQQIVSLPGYQADRGSVGNSEFAWWGRDTFSAYPNLQPSGVLGMVVRDSPGQNGRAFLQVYYPTPGVMHVLARVDETLYDAVWSSDGKWVFYSTDSGLWALNVPATLAGNAGPALLNRDVFIDLELDSSPDSRSAPEQG